MALLLGIDGGATKTSFALAEDDKVLATVNGGGTNLNHSTLEHAEHVLRTSIANLCAKAGVQSREIACTSMGVAGASRADVRDALLRLMANIVAGKLEVVTDVEIALAASFHDGAGVIVLAGTGSIAYGRNPLAQTARVGGWGRAVSDEGSGDWIGRQAVSAVLRTLDAARKTTLAEHVLNTWHVATREDLAALCNGQPPPEFSMLFPAVLRAANEGDAVAGELLAAAGIQLAELARVVLRCLWLEDEPVEVTAEGGVFRNCSRIFEVFAEFLRADRPQAIVRMASAQPVMGALFRARKLGRQAEDPMELS